MKIAASFLAVLLIGSAVLSGEETYSSMAPSPAFDKLKTLAGSWTGNASESGHAIAATVRFKVVSDGSALTSWLGEDTPHEMVTIFHLDGSDLLATHYCSAHNQPRMVLQGGTDPNKLVFRFKDGTNIQPGAGHMSQLAILFDGPDHHIEDWTFFDGQKDLPAARFDFHRKP